jgi:8-oxo-dGTP diphosphatase
MPSVGVFAAIFNEHNHILLVKIKYGSQNWTLPGGHLDPHESPIDGVKREILEETGFVVEVDHLISLYSAPEKDDLVLLFKANIKEQMEWTTHNEIDQIAFFNKDNLPLELHPWNKKRIEDVYENKFSHLRIFS